MAPRKSRRTDAKGSPSLDTTTEVDLNTNSPVQQQSPPDSESLAAGSSADPTLAADTDAHLKRWDELELEGVRVEVELEEWAKSEKQSWHHATILEWEIQHEALNARGAFERPDNRRTVVPG